MEIHIALWNKHTKKTKRDFPKASGNEWVSFGTGGIWASAGKEGRWISLEVLEG